MTKNSNNSPFRGSPVGIKPQGKSLDSKSFGSEAVSIEVFSRNKPELKKDTQTKILITARKLFYKYGFASVSTSQLASKAEVSKSSLYKYYKNMEGILKAVVRYEVQNFIFKPHYEIKTYSDFYETLVDFGANLLNFLNRKDIIKFNQLVFSESWRSSNISAIFYDSAYTQSYKALSSIFEIAKNQEHLKTEFDTFVLSQQLISLWEGDGFIQAQLGINNKPLEPREWSKQCVDLILNGIS